MLGFGFALFLMLVTLAVIYAQFAMQRQPNPAEMNSMKKSPGEMGTTMTAPMAMPLPATVTPETAADDLIDEALADRDDLSAFAEDEAADSEEGGATVNSLNTVYDESENQ
jgi:H+/gluconate symporter-like permease